MFSITRLSTDDISPVTAASVFPRPPKRLGTLGQRAGPVRLISGSPRISAPPCPRVTSTPAIHSPAGDRT
jgi:hypothetical protein